MHLSEKPLIPEAVIQERVNELAKEVSHDFAGHDLLVVSVLKGAMIFAADFVRRLDLKAKLEFARVKSYVGTESSGKLDFMHLPEEPITGKYVLLVEDILDTGRTAAALRAHFEAEQPARLAFCTLLDKPATRVVPVTAEYVGFSVEDRFVVGYGLDCDEHYRHLPDIWTLEPDEETPSN